MADRRVHGHTADGGEIVRYEKAGKWYAEYPGRMIPRERLSVMQAAIRAAHGRPVFNVPGGMAFDRKVLDELGYIKRMQEEEDNA